MNLADFQPDLHELGGQMHGLIAELYPICRSITGDGVRQTLERIRAHIPLTVHEVPSGTRCFDWVVPKEWNIRDAWVKNSRGERVIDFRKSNLHIMSYSRPVRQTVSLAELKEHLYTLPEHPDWIPHRTSYFKENWGFSLRYNDLLALKEDRYEVCIDSTLADGHLSFGEYGLPGESDAEVLVSCHVCHPSLCNDNLSGVAIATFLAKSLTRVSRRYSYRFLFIPATIGSIAWLALNEHRVEKIRHGVVLACAGDSGNSTYKKSRRGNAEIDRAFQHVLQHSGRPYQVMEFAPYGYDERQYCSPGFNLPVGCLMRTPYGQFPEYHTSADNLAFVRPQSLADSFAKCCQAFAMLENNCTYVNQNPKCEPQLGKRGLYRAVGGRPEHRVKELEVLWVLNGSDGEQSLLDIAERSGLEFDALRKAAEALLACGLLQEKKSVPAGNIAVSSSSDNAEPGLDRKKENERVCRS